MLLLCARSVSQRGSPTAVAMVTVNQQQDPAGCQLTVGILGRCYWLAWRLAEFDWELLLFACADDVRHFSFYRAKFIVNSVTQFSLQKLLVVEIKSSFVSYLLKVDFCVNQDLLALKLTPISKMSKPWAFYFLDSGRTWYLTSGGYVCNKCLVDLIGTINP